MGDGAAVVDFIVKEVRRSIESLALPTNPYIHGWNPWVMIKVNFHCWRAALNSSGLELTDLLLSACNFAKDVWFKLRSWCGLPNYNGLTIKTFSKHLSWFVEELDIRILFTPFLW
ncbi:hypothetical protein R6Q59_028575 [Mikania micrantha]